VVVPAGGQCERLNDDKPVVFRNKPISGWWRVRAAWRDRLHKLSVTRGTAETAVGTWLSQRADVPVAAAAASLPALARGA